uniref:Uncharacterized protein n=1 Tax=Anguilla anguilla TaxID=7936 RepID=A0A0E9RFC1_ANGAN
MDYISSSGNLTYQFHSFSFIQVRIHTICILYESIAYFSTVSLKVHQLQALL